MAIFGAVPGLTIFTMAAVFLLGIAFLGGAVVVSLGGTVRRARITVFTVSALFILTTVLALLSAIEEGGYVTRITGG